jgi:hypothetical protein
MEQELSYKIYSVACLPKNRIALASEQGCYLITNPFSPTTRYIKNLRKQPTFRLIANESKNKICLCGAREIEIYDVNSEKKLESHRIINCTTFSAVFSPFDDSVVTRQDNDLYINGIKRYTLPYVGSNHYFSIDCHPNGQEILYSSSDSTLTCRNIRGGPGCDYSQNFCIRRAFYSPNGNHIAIISHEGKVTIYDPERHRSAVCIQGSSIHDAAFLPDHKSIALVDEFGTLYFSNFSTEKPFFLSITGPSNAQESSSLNKIVISPNKSECAVLIENHCFIGNIPAPFIKNKMLFICWALRKYSKKHDNFLLPEIICLLMESVAAAQQLTLTLVAL